MTDVTGVFWRDIPAQVIVKIGRRTAKRILSDRFQEAIDRAAMRSKSSGADTYLEDWRRVPIDVPGAPWDADEEKAAEQAASILEERYDDSRLATLVAAGGWS